MLSTGAPWRAAVKRRCCGPEQTETLPGGAVAGVATSASIILGGKCFEGTPDSTLAGVTPSGTPVYCAVGVAALFAFPLVALAIDDAFLARAPVEETPPQATHATVAPSLVVKPGLALLGLGASF
ncbi:MAG TPA: hypothetical protein VH853_24380 [Polyangia bacterium]|jgi:hypothetical protein|nr:hypothetical protein [Polyangia bacterium]